MEIKPNYYLVGSSLFLSLPGIFFLQRAEYIGTAISFGCCLLSIAWHSTKPRYQLILYLDMFFANLSAVLAIHTSLRGLPYSLVPISFFMGGSYVLYHVGHVHKCFAWDSDLATATRWHSLIHIGNGVLGTCIVFLINSDALIEDGSKE